MKSTEFNWIAFTSIIFYIIVSIILINGIGDKDIQYQTIVMLLGFGIMVQIVFLTYGSGNNRKKAKTKAQ